jgi:peptide/nickel transport system permease protein
MLQVAFGVIPVADFREIDPVIGTTLMRRTNIYSPIPDRCNWTALFSSPAPGLAHHHLGLILSGVSSHTRINVIETLAADFIAAARARGIREHILVYAHALKNALIPVITLIGLQVAILLAGAVLTETVFSWTGMGSYLVERISMRDYTAVQSVITVFALLVALISLAVDVIYCLVDPRVRY